MVANVGVGRVTGDSWQQYQQVLLTTSQYFLVIKSASRTFLSLWVVTVFVHDTQNKKCLTNKVHIYFGIYWIFTSLAGCRINARKTTTLNINLMSAQRNYFALFYIKLYKRPPKCKIGKRWNEMSVQDSQPVAEVDIGKAEMRWGHCWKSIYILCSDKT